MTEAVVKHKKGQGRKKMKKESAELKGSFIYEAHNGDDDRGGSDPVR